mgnify:CR=1 FL=1
MCLGHLFKKRINIPEPKYIPLQSIISEPITYNVKKLVYYKKTHKIGIRKKNINDITLLKDRILLGEIEYIKYDYIVNFVRGHNNTLIINTFTDVNVYSRELIVSDCITSIIIVLDEPVANKAIDNCVDYITSYKKYNSFDKSVKNFRCFKILFSN